MAFSDIQHQHSTVMNSYAPFQVSIEINSINSIEFTIYNEMDIVVYKIIAICIKCFSLTS